MGYSIGELANKAGVTVRTIRFYISEGVLPPPGVAGRFASYSDAHLARLRLIGRLKGSYLPLQAIRERLANLTDEQAIELASDETAQTPAGAPTVSRSSASDYIRDVLSAKHVAPALAPAPCDVVAMTGRPEHWERRVLGPGIELHIRLPLSASRRELVREIEAIARDDGKWS